MVVNICFILACVWVWRRVYVVKTYKGVGLSHLRKPWCSNLIITSKIEMGSRQRFSNNENDVVWMEIRNLNGVHEMLGVLKMWRFFILGKEVYEIEIWYGYGHFKSMKN